MQNEDDADYETWKRQIEKNLAELDGVVIVAGHSHADAGSMHVNRHLSDVEYRP